MLLTADAVFEAARDCLVIDSTGEPVGEQQRQEQRVGLGEMASSRLDRDCSLRYFAKNIGIVIKI